MNTIKIPVIEHEDFLTLLYKNKDIFHRLFGANKFGIPLLKCDTLHNRINNICSKLIHDYTAEFPDSPGQPGTGLDRFKGKVYEIFINAFLILKGSDPRVGVSDYIPVNGIDDYGVDGIGKGMDNKNLTVQIKYRSNPKTILYQDDMRNFGFQSLTKYDVDKHTTTNLLLISSCAGLHPVVNAGSFNGQIRELTHTMLKDMIDDNTIFWQELLTLVNNTIILKLGKKRLSIIEDINIELCDE
jgi:hypothetical protein